jgi:ribosome-interacting GTPase 1
MSSLTVAKSCNKSKKITTCTRKQQKEGLLPPIKINQYLEVVDGYEIYALLKELKVKTCKCEVRGDITIDIECLDINSEKYKSDIATSIASTADIFGRLADKIKSQDYRCYCCNKIFGRDENSIAEEMLLKPERLGGSYQDDENIVAVHHICRDLKGNFNWNDKIKYCILSELEEFKYL